MGVGCCQPSACMARNVSGRRVRSPNVAGASDVAVKIEIASLCSGQLTGCGYCRVSWCRHLRVSRRIQLATRRPATHNARDAAFGIPRRTHYDDVNSVSLLRPEVKPNRLSPTRPAVSAVTPAFPLTSTAGPPAPASRGTSPAGPAAPAVTISEGRSFAAGTRLVDDQRAALVLLAVHGRDGVGGLLHRHLHEPEPARGDESGLGHRAIWFEQGTQILLGDVIWQIPYIQTLRRHW